MPPPLAPSCSVMLGGGMMRLWLLALPLAVAFAADEPALILRNPPFEVASAAGVKPARELMSQFLQLRWYLGSLLDKPEMGSVFPIRVVVFKGNRAGQYPAALRLGRDAYTAAVADSHAPPALMRQVAALLLRSNSGRMPDAVENGLLDLVSTLRANGPRVTIGAPPPGGGRNLDWARMRLLALNPDYAGKLRVLLVNLRHGIELGPSCRNAFGKTFDSFEAEAKLALNAPPDPAEISGMPLNPERDLVARKLEQETARLLVADLVGTPAAYASLETPEAADGRALAGGSQAALAAAAARGSGNARVWLEFAKRTQNAARKREALESASRLNPHWAEPELLLASLDADPLLQVRHLRQAAARDPRNANVWMDLARVEMRLNHFRESDKAWAAAEGATGSVAERERIRAARAAIENQRLAQEADERRRAGEEKQRQIQDLKNKALERIRVAEMKINRGEAPLDPKQKIEPWWDGPKTAASVNGMLERVDCLNGPVRLTVAGEGHSQIRLLIPDPGQLTTAGTGDRTFACGPQKPPRPVTVGYNPKRDAHYNTVGEAVSLEFH